MKTVLFACLMGAAFTASAQASAPATVTGPYIGLGVVASQHEFLDGTKGSLKLFGGYDFNQSWGIEGGILGGHEFKNSHQGIFQGEDFLMKQKYRTTTSYVAAKATLPIAEDWSVVGKLGLAHGRTRGEFSLTGQQTDRFSSSENGVYAAVGLKYKLNKDVALTLELEHMGKKTDYGTKPETISVNAAYQF